MMMIVMMMIIIIRIIILILSSGPSGTCLFCGICQFGSTTVVNWLKVSPIPLEFLPDLCLCLMWEGVTKTQMRTLWRLVMAKMVLIWRMTLLHT